MITQAQLLAKNPTSTSKQFRFVLGEVAAVAVILNLVDWGAFSGEVSGFDIVTPAGTYIFGFSVGESSTNQTIYDSIEMYLPGSETPVTVLVSDYFKIVMYAGKIYIVLLATGCEVQTDSYFDASAMTVTDGTFDDSYTLKYAPDGWNDDEFQLKRDLKLFGVFRKFTVAEMAFVKDGRDYLLPRYEATGVNTDTTFSVYELTHSGIERIRFRGKIDYSTFKRTEISVNVQVIDGSFTDLILKRAKTEVNLFSLKSIDGATLPAYQNQLITIPQITINQIANWEGFDYSTVYPGAHYIFLNLVNSEYPEARSVSAYGFNMFNDATEEYVNANFKYKIQATLNGNNSSARFTYDYYISKWILGVETVVYHGVINGIGVYPLEVDLDLTEIFTINSGDALSFRATINNTVGTGTVQYSHVEVKLTTVVSDIATREINTMLYHEAFEQCGACLAGLSGRFKSDFFGRTDIGYAQDGVIGGITTGRYIRDMWGLNDTLPVTLDALFASVQAVYNLGMGVEEINGVEMVVIEPMEHFFNSTVILDISNRIAEETIEKTYYPEVSFNRISVGYNSYDYRSLGGIYEFNTTSKFSTIIKPVDKELNIVAPYRADMSGVIALITEPGANKDIAGESDIFLLDTIRDGIGGYVLRTVEGFDQTEDLSNRDILFNLNISPKRNLIRWGSYLRGFLEKYLTSLISWQTSDKNTKLSSTETGQSAVVENADILVSTLNNPLWHPETFTVEVPALETDIELIKANPYGLIKLTATEYGWILNYNSKNTNKKSEYTLLRCNTNYVTPIGDPVYPATITINKTVSNAVVDYTTFFVNIIGDNGMSYTHVGLSTEGKIILNNVPYGNYTITEDETTGYDLSYISPSVFTVNEENLHFDIEIVNWRKVGGLGALYNWYAANNALIAEGDFNVPIKSDFETFMNHIGNANPNFNDWPFWFYPCANKLREVGINSWDHPNEGATDLFNFKAVGSGYRNVSVPPGLLATYGGRGRASMLWQKDFYTVYGSMIYVLHAIEISFGETVFQFYPNTSYGEAEKIENIKKQGYSIRLFRLANESELLLPDGTYCDDYIDYDENHYTTVKIGTQVWMCDNLKTTHYSDGTPIPIVPYYIDWAALTTEGMCYYDNDPLNA